MLSLVFFNPSPLSLLPIAYPVATSLAIAAFGRLTCHTYADNAVVRRLAHATALMVLLLLVGTLYLTPQQESATACLQCYSHDRMLYMALATL